MRSKVENFVLVGIGKNTQVANIRGNEEFDAIWKQYEQGKLRQKHPHDKLLGSHPRFHHNTDMMYLPDERGNNVILRDDVLMCEPSDEDGTLELTGDEAGEKLAKLLIKVLRSGPKWNVKLAKHSKPFSDAWEYEKIFPVSTPKKEYEKALKDGLKD